MFDPITNNFVIVAGQVQSHCRLVNSDPKRIICVCNEQLCDRIQFHWPTQSGQASLIRTSQAGFRFNVSQLTTWSSPSAGGAPSELNVIDIDLANEYQTILGWGGAFTDAATININSLSQQVADRLIESYYGESGLQYNMGRVPIAGSDFSTRTYSYDDHDDDYNLTQWSLASEDLNHKIPVIKKAIKMAESFKNELKLLASPWSPPKWMKTSHDFRRGHLIDKDEIYSAYANYLVKFYQAYQEHGINFWGATVQNEPIAAYLPFYYFNSLQMSNAEAIRFIGHHLGPALEASGRTKDNFKLFVGDDSLGFINHQVPVIMQDKLVQKYVSGLAFHWYTSGNVVSYDYLSKLVDSIRDHIDYVIMSEACAGTMPFLRHVDLGSWQRAESYVLDIMNDLERHTAAWIDWNLALDQHGGPNWARNFVDSPIIVNSEKNEFYKQPMYYALAHFSRLFRQGSVRVGTKLRSDSGSHFRKISTIAVHNKQTGHLIVNVLNKSNSMVQISVSVNGSKGRLHTIEPFSIEQRSVNSVVIKL